MSKRERDADAITDSDESDEDLADFIVKDKMYKSLTKKTKKTDDSQPDDADVPEEESETEVESVQGEPLPEDGPELEKITIEEAAKIAANLQTTVVNGRTLRDRSKIAAPKDTQWEKYGKDDLKKLLVKDQKKDYLDEIKKIKKDFDRNPDNYNAPPEDFRWPSLTMKDSFESIKAALDYISQALSIEYTDDDESESLEEESDEELSSLDESSSDESEDSEDEEDSDDDDVSDDE